MYVGKGSIVEVKASFNTYRSSIKRILGDQGAVKLIVSRKCDS